MEAAVLFCQGVSSCCLTKYLLKQPLTFKVRVQNMYIYRVHGDLHVHKVSSFLIANVIHFPPRKTGMDTS